MRRLPLEGIRILEPGQAWALPFAITPLAALGAQVIKIESTVRPDMSRGQPQPDGQPPEDYWNHGGAYHEMNRNKLGVTLDLRTEAGVRVFKELVTISDVVAENFPPRVMHNFGLDYQALRAIKPDLIYLSSTAYGNTGPWRNYIAYGSALQAVSGLTWVTGYEDGPPVQGGLLYNDVISAMNATFAILTALAFRTRTGKGQWIDLAQYEVAVSQLGEMVLEYAFTGRAPARQGNHDPALAPHQVFPCQGNDRWIAIACRSDHDWEQLRMVMGNPAWAADSHYATAPGRKAHEADLEQGIAAWTRGFPPEELMQRLQAAGVPAGVVATNKDLLLDPQLRARDFFRTVAQPAPTGLRPHLRSSWPISGIQPPPDQPAPTLGQHNRYVLAELLGYPPDQIVALEAQGITGMVPAQRRPQRPAPPEELLRQGFINEYNPDYKTILGLS